VETERGGAVLAGKEDGVAHLGFYGEEDQSSYAFGPNFQGDVCSEN
jgi:hypothetical protein